MSKFINCPRCGKFFEPKGLSNVCPDCFEQELAEFDRIREYLFLHPKAKVFEVSNVLNISIAKIKYFLREGRLEIIEKNNLFLRCEMCGKPICSGTCCDECQKQAAHDYKSTYVGVSAQKLNYLPAGKTKRP
jgi:hypothetical protein